MRDRPDDAELAALLALDALEPEEQADAELRLGTWPTEQAPAVGALAESVAAAPPADLRASLLARATGRRPAGRPVDPPAEVSPEESYRRSVEDFRALLDTLEEPDWDVVAHEEHGRVRDLVAHLAGVEQLNRRWLDPADDVPHLPDHVAATRPFVEELAGTAPAEVARVWHEAALALLEAARGHDETGLVTFHDLAVTVGGLLTIRTFELWAHAMDIAVATGRPVPLPDDSRMQLMSSRLVGALPFALAYRGAVPEGRTARLVLTGAAGGCYDVALDPAGPPPGPGEEPDVVLVADVVDVCRVAAARLAPEELVRTVEGDAALAGLVLAHLDAFARD